MEYKLVRLAAESVGLDIEVPEEFFSFHAGDELKLALGPSGERYFEFSRMSGVSNGVRIYLEERTGNIVAGTYLDRLFFANSSIGHFNECVRMVASRYPFCDEYAEPEDWDLVAEEVERIVNSIDPPATEGVTFWNDFRADVSIGDYA